MTKAKSNYGNESIVSLKGPDKVRKRPSVIFGSDGIDGCQHSVFEILSNSIDEAREGHGDKIIVTRYKDLSIEVEDFGRGIPVDYNNREKKYNWELVFCKLYAGGKYNNNDNSHYEYSLGLNGLGLCATQFASEYMEAEIHNGGHRYNLRFEKGFNAQKGEKGFEKKAVRGKKTGTKIRWKPDLEVFTDIEVSKEYFEETLKRQAVVNSGLLFIFRWQNDDGTFEESEFLYEDGIKDYLMEIVGKNALTTPQFYETQRKGRDRKDRPEYRVKLSTAFCFSNRVKRTEFYHNSSFLEYGGSPERAVRQAFVSEIDSYLKQGNKYLKGEIKITFADDDDCLVLISSSFSTQTSYENQTKKAINNKFIYDAMTAWLKQQIEVYFIENPTKQRKFANWC